jgi:hypothetical protein
MYLLKERACESGRAASINDFNSVVLYYKDMKELYKYVHPYIQTGHLKTVIMEDMKKELHLCNKFNKSTSPKDKQYLKKKLWNIIDVLEKKQMLLGERIKSAGLELPMNKSNPNNAIKEGFN